jgi:hypothetical protein
MLLQIYIGLRVKYPVNRYALQQDTQSVLMSKFYSALMLARHVSDLTGPSPGAFCTSCICRFGMWQYAYYSTCPAVTERFVQAVFVDFGMW